MNFYNIPSYSIFYRLYSTPINLYKQNNYCNDGDNVRFPWYNDNAVITIEGPTDKHSIVQVLVRLNFFLSNFKSGINSNQKFYLTNLT